MTCSGATRGSRGGELDKLSCSPFAESRAAASAAGWIVIGRGARAADRTLIEALTPALHSASLATVTLDLPAQTRAAASQVHAAAAGLRADTADGLPVAYLGAGIAAQAGWIASLGGGLDGVIAWNGLPGAAWSQLSRVEVPSLLVVEHGLARLPLHWLIAKALDWKLGAGAGLALVEGRSALDAGAIVRWYWENVIEPVPLVRPRSTHVIRARRQLTRVGAAAALVVPSLGAVAAQPASAARSVPDFSRASKLAAHEIRGDSSGTQRAKPAPKNAAGKRLGAADIHGDHMAGPAPLAPGSQPLIDGSGVKYFVNTNITFSTSSSASGAMEEASYTHSVSATTLNGGTVQSRLNDAYDGYEALCVSVNGTTGTCQTGNSNWSIYEKNGPAAAESNGRQIDFAPQTVGSLSISRKVFVPSNDSFARWINVITNNGSSPQTLTVATGNNLGSDANTIIVNDSSGNTTPTTADTWVTTFQNYSGTTSSDPRLGHVFGSPGATAGLSAMHFANGDDNPWWDYSITLPPGATRIIVNYGVVQPSKAAAASKSADLASMNDAHQFDFMSDVEKAEVLNYAIKPPAAADTYSTPHDTPLSEAAPGVLANDGPLTTASLVSGPSHAASFALHPDGSFAYTPAAGFAGTDSFTYEAKGLGGGSSTPTTVTLHVIGVAPAISSASSATFTVGKPGSFTVRSNGIPKAAITESGSLPAGLHFTDNGDGTATISGTPARGTSGSHAITITAANGQGSPATQRLTLVVKPGGPLHAAQIRQIERSLLKILASYRSIVTSTHQILAGVSDPKVANDVEKMLLDAASHAKEAKALYRKVRAEKTGPKLLGQIARGRRQAAIARRIAADARIIASKARAHG